jgi:hypothetical protein
VRRQPRREQGEASDQQGEQAAQCHQDTTGPDPVDKGLVIDADGPFGFRPVAVDRLAEGFEQGLWKDAR